MKTIVINNDSELRALCTALEMYIDFIHDTITDEVPYKASQIRKLAMLPDEELEKRLENIHKDINEKIDLYLNARMFFERLA